MAAEKATPQAAEGKQRNAESAPRAAADKPSAEKSKSEEDQVNTARTALKAIAFLLAFLTVVGVWKIPPSQTRLTGPQGVAPTAGAADAKADAKSDAAKIQESASPFGSNFGRTVIAGVGGIAAIEILKDAFPTAEGFNPRAFYMLWFVVFFFIILLLSSVMRAWAECLRSRIAAGDDPVLPARLAPAGEQAANKPQDDQRDKSVGLKCKQQEAESATLEKEQTKRNKQRHRRRSRLVFFDTLFNVIQGNNQLQTAALGDTIMDLQRSLQSAADRVRTSIQRTVRGVLMTAQEKGAEHLKGEDLKKLKDCDIDDQAVRVSISILSPDGTALSYVSRSPGSLFRYFDRSSVAWVAVCSGRALWWKQSYEAHPEIILLDKDSTALPDVPKPLLLKDYFQKRESRDYEAFLVLPIPWYRRGLAARYRCAGIHISFRHAMFLDALVAGRLEPKSGDAEAEVNSHQPHYKRWQTLLVKPSGKAEESVNIADDSLRAVLLQAIEMLGEILCYYNEEVLALGDRVVKDAR